MRVALALSGTLMMAAPFASAAQDIGTRIGITAGRKDGELVMQQIAACVADRQRSQVRALLATPPGSDRLAKMHAKLGVEYEYCMGENDRLITYDRQIAMKYPTLRRALAVNMFSLQFRTAPDTLPGGEAAFRWFGGQIAEDAYQQDENLSAYQLARCVMRKDWPGVRTLLKSSPATPGEVAAMRALAPVVVPCVPHGLGVALTPSILRSILTEATYYSLVAAGDAPRS